ncbi:hypothetical protein LSAT2_031387 [Lamellibrachia satsuma]|nr:hypothetical protein LSAT2_031387 [Lamellibrachia satsuma]
MVFKRCVLEVTFHVNGVDLTYASIWQTSFTDVDIKQWLRRIPEESHYAATVLLSRRDTRAIPPLLCALLFVRVSALRSKPVSLNDIFITCAPRADTGEGVSEVGQVNVHVGSRSRLQHNRSSSVDSVISVLH